MSNKPALRPEIVAFIVDRFSPRPEVLTGHSVRFPLRHCTAVARIAGEQKAPRALDIELVDLGLSGVGFDSPEPIPSGEALTVELHVPGLPRQVWACRVVGVHSFDGARYRMGARIESAIPA